MKSMQRYENRQNNGENVKITTNSLKLKTADKTVDRPGSNLN